MLEGTVWRPRCCAAEIRHFSVFASASFVLWYTSWQLRFSIQMKASCLKYTFVMLLQAERFSCVCCTRVVWFLRGRTTVASINRLFFTMHRKLQNWWDCLPSKRRSSIPKILTSYLEYGPQDCLRLALVLDPHTKMRVWTSFVSVEPEVLRLCGKISLLFPNWTGGPRDTFSGKCCLQLGDRLASKMNQLKTSGNHRRRAHSNSYCIPK